MIELLFSDSAAGALMCAKSLGNGTIIGGVSDWWYSGRLRMMIASGEVKITRENKTFYGSAMIKIQ